MSIFNKNPDIGSKKKTYQRISMNQQLSAKAANFQKFLSSRGIEEKVVELSESTRTSAEAAAAIHCEVEEISKSIVFYQGYPPTYPGDCKRDK